MIKSVLISAQQQIVEALHLDKSTARLEARLLLQDLLGIQHAGLLIRETEELDPTTHQRFQQQLARRLAGEPIAYILGHREFFGLDLQVTVDTLIPRPDTETLVEAALAQIPIDQDYAVLDLGTGTGAVALAIASKRPKAHVTAVDFSQRALTVAKDNAQRLGLNRVEFIESDWFSQLGEHRFDLIVSNPPYIAEDDIHLSEGDLRFEPRTALAAGKDGLDDIRQIINKAQMHLNQEGSLLLEHGYDQAEKVSVLMQAAGFANIQHFKDLAGTNRVTAGRWPQPR